MEFTKSKFDSNLYLKVMDDEPDILLLYVDDLFMTGNEKQITNCKKKLVEEFKMKRSWIDVLFPRDGSVEELLMNLSGPGKVCCGNIKNI